MKERTKHRFCITSTLFYNVQKYDFNNSWMCFSSTSTQIFRALH